MLTQQETKSLIEISEIASSCNIYLYGRSLRNIILGQEKESIDIFIQTTSEKKLDEIIPLVEKHILHGFRFKSGPSLDLSDSLITIDTVYCDCHKLIEGNSIIEAKNTGLKDLKGKRIKLTKYAEEHFEDDPELILDVVLQACQCGFSFTYESMSLLFKYRHYVKNISKRQVFNFLSNVFKQSKKTRKAIATINTLGLSSELFDYELVESAELNHLNKNDLFEYFALIFNNIDPKELENFLIEKVGFVSKEKDYVLQVIEAINLATSEDRMTARNILSVYDKKRIRSCVNLFKVLGFKELSKIIKEEHSSPTSIYDLRINEQDIKSALGVNDDECKRLLDLALKIVINDPSMNNRGKLLVQLHKEMESIQ